MYIYKSKTHQTSIKIELIKFNYIVGQTYKIEQNLPIKPNMNPINKVSYF